VIPLTPVMTPVSSVRNINAAVSNHGRTHLLSHGALSAGTNTAFVAEEDEESPSDVDRSAHASTRKSFCRGLPVSKIVLACIMILNLLAVGGMVCSMQRGSTPTGARESEPHGARSAKQRHGIVTTGGANASQIYLAEGSAHSGGKVGRNLTIRPKADNR
jgi:hypothetical protein